MKILIVDDEETLAEGLRTYIELEGYDAHIASGAEEALKLDIASYDLILLDIMMGGMSGTDMAGILKKNPATADIPIIFLTAKDEDDDMVAGLRLGADDYITKPFSLAVLRARVNAQLRRSAPVKPDRIELNGFIFDFAQLEFSKDGTIIDLSKTEQRLLRLLVENRGRTLPRELLLEKVWDGGEFVDENALSVAVRRLRIKLGDAPIKTVYGVGYTWEAGK